MKTEIASFADRLVLTALGLRALQKRLQLRDEDFFERGQFAGAPALFCYSTDRAFAVVFGPDKALLGIHRTASK